jgi:ribonucleoside-diphosphate reductase alpha chain
MNASNKLLSDIVAFRTYAKFLPTKQRRESLEETINRTMVMHLDRFPKLSKEITKAFTKVHNLSVMPSMRTLQFAGDAILKNNARGYNCSFAPISDIRVFSEGLFVMLSGCGFGYSVQKHNIEKLPKVGRTKEENIFIVHDSIMGWAQALEALMSAYFNSSIRPVFDFSNIRPKGSYLVTTGARAPGPEPLKKMLEQVEEKLKTARDRKLTSLEVHDIMCIIAQSVLSGGIRRAAMIVLFDRDDTEMLKCKSGEWWIKYPYRARANNSAVLPRNEVSKEEFYEIFKMTQESGAGEPGFFWTNDINMGTNPCCEIALNPFQFCNLSTINQTGITSKKEFLSRIYSASLLGTLQASYTDFPYLRDIWRQTTEAEALLGVSSTGIADAANLITEDWLQEGAKLALDVNEKYAKKLGINPAARVTAIKPEGTSSTVLMSSSGIHDRHAPFYLRRIRMNKDDPLTMYLKHTIPELVEDDLFDAGGAVVTIPQESPNGALLRNNTSAIDLLNRAIKYNQNWVAPGHRSGKNMHNVSCTVSVKDHEWSALCDAMWQQKDLYTGISLLPYDGGTYQQAPFEECTKEVFDSLSLLVKNIDLREVKEEQDNTARMDAPACAGGLCEII